jgi:hypothetical protein
MVRDIIVTCGNQKIIVSLFENSMTEHLLSFLPLDSQAHLWGEEIYFYISQALEIEGNLQSEVQAGDFAYWPQGPALCIFLGPTPISKGDKIIPASEVAVLGKVINMEEIDIDQITSGTSVRVKPST